MTELLVGFAYSLSGFVVGFVVGRVGREVHEIKETVVPQTFATEDELHHARATRLGVIVIIMSLLTVAMGVATMWQQREQAQCFKEYNGQFYVAFQARAKANDNDRVALNTMLISLADNNLDSAERRVAFARYIASIKQSEVTRAKNPLPQPPDPRTACE